MNQPVHQSRLEFATGVSWPRPLGNPPGAVARFHPAREGPTEDKKDKRRNKKASVLAPFTSRLAFACSSKSAFSAFIRGLGPAFSFFVLSLLQSFFFFDPA